MITFRKSIKNSLALIGQAGGGIVYFRILKSERVWFHLVMAKVGVGLR